MSEKVTISDGTPDAESKTITFVVSKGQCSAKIIYNADEDSVSDPKGFIFEFVTGNFRQSLVDEIKEIGADQAGDLGWMADVPKPEEQKPEPVKQAGSRKKLKKQDKAAEAKKKKAKTTPQSRITKITIRKYCIELNLCDGEFQTIALPSDEWINWTVTLNSRKNFHIGYDTEKMRFNDNDAAYKEFCEYPCSDMILSAIKEESTKKTITRRF